MIRCEECLRANPPTRVSCIYCQARLPTSESWARLRQPALRAPEKHQTGHNNILLPLEGSVATTQIAEAAQLLKLSPENVRAVLAESVPLPVARSTSSADAELVVERLNEMGLKCLAVSDEDLGLSFSDYNIKRVKSMSMADAYLTIQQAGTVDHTDILWSEIVLILPGRLRETRLEIKEAIGGKREKELLDATELFRDEVVLDFYSANHSATWRVSTGGFDFSCLGGEMTLIANENIERLRRLLVEKSVNAQLDDSYGRVRNLLELAWGSRQETQASGWQRERPGKLSVGVATTKTNEAQFTRYSRLRYYLCLRPATSE